MISRRKFFTGVSLGALGSVLPSWCVSAARRDADLLVAAVRWSTDGGLTWHDDPVAAGDEVWFQAVVRNIGQAGVAPGKGIDAEFHVNANRVSWAEPQNVMFSAGDTLEVNATDGVRGDPYWVPTADGQFTVRATVDWRGRVIELSEANNSTTATIVVDPGLIPPIVANDDAASTGIDETVIIDVLANDTGPGELEIVGVQSPTDHGGTAIITSDGKFIEYTPPAGFEGDDRFTYEVGLVA